MGALIKNLQIKNFKSVRDLSLDCERINIFIGKPNAGKSNILEAISLLGAGYSVGNFKGKIMEGFIRYQTLVQLFSNFDYHNFIEIKTEQARCTLGIDRDKENYEYFLTLLNPEKNDKSIVPFLEIGCSKTGEINTIGGTSGPITVMVKKYTFRLFEEFKDNDLSLHPPYGNNFYFIVRSHPELLAEIQRFLQPNGLEFLLDEESQRMMIVRRTETTLISFPMHLVPDTFQRYIFHLAAIMSNSDSVLLFEEPETHSYAPYVYQLAQHIIQDEQNNQYFLTTHNPYFLLPILEEARDVAVFFTWFENYQTHARRLSEEEIRIILNDGIDVFINPDSLIAV